MYRTYKSSIRLLCVCLFWNFNPSKAWNFKTNKRQSRRIELKSTLESGINIGVRLLIFEFIIIQDWRDSYGFNIWNLSLNFKLPFLTLRQLQTWPGDLFQQTTVDFHIWKADTMANKLLDKLFTQLITFLLHQLHHWFSLRPIFDVLERVFRPVKINKIGDLPIGDKLNY